MPELTVPGGSGLVALTALASELFHTLDISVTPNSKSLLEICLRHPD